MNREQNEDLKKRLRQAALAGAGVTGAMAATEGTLSYLRDADFMAKNRPTKEYYKFLAQLQPGDVVFHRKGLKHGTDAHLDLPDGIKRALGIQTTIKTPLKESALMLATKGDPFYHASVYRGGGEVLEAGGVDKGVSRSRLSHMTGGPEELIVMRAKEKALQRKAAERAEAIYRQGTMYRDTKGLLSHAGKHLAGLAEETGGSIKQFVKGGDAARGIVCTEFGCEVMPEVFKDRLASPKDMRFNPDLDFVARYRPPHNAITRAENVLAHGVYPLLRNAKYGLAAGGAALGLGALMDYAKGQGET